jgi:hypothetical protein
MDLRTHRVRTYSSGGGARTAKAYLSKENEASPILSPSRETSAFFHELERIKSALREKDQKLSSLKEENVVLKQVFILDFAKFVVVCRLVAANSNQFWIVIKQFNLM